MVLYRSRWRHRSRAYVRPRRRHRITGPKAAADGEPFRSRLRQTVGGASVNRIAAATLIALTMASQYATAQAKPNFSGSWKMDTARSDFGPVPAPVPMDRKITHAEPSLTIVEGQDAGGGVETVTRP